jgi:hypothetical protein
MPLYVRAAPVKTWTMDELERTYLARLNGQACTAIGIQCKSENEAIVLMNAYTIKQDCTRGIEKISHPSPVPVDILHFKRENSCSIGVAKEFISTNTPGKKTIQAERYYFLINLLPIDLGEYLDKMSRRRSK